MSHSRKRVEQPLYAILSWWEAIEDFPRSQIAADVCFRLTTNKDIMDKCETQFRDFLYERLDAARYIGRTLAVRAVIDFQFFETDMERSLNKHLENVEGDNRDLKRMSNAAIGRHMKVAPEWENARNSWLKLRELAISDASLISFERACQASSKRLG